MKEELLSWHNDVMEMEIPDRGKEDGSSNVPSEKSVQISPYEKQLRSKYQGVVNSLGGDREKEISTCSKEKIDNLKNQRNKITQEVIDKEVNSINKSEEEALKKEEDVQIQIVKEITGDAQLKRARLSKRESKQQYDEICKELDRTTTDRSDIPNDTWYKVILGFIGVSELAINYQVFQIFRENLVLTLIMSLCLVITALLAHQTGSQLKQFKESNNKMTEAFLLIVINVFTFSLFAVIAYMRSQLPNVPEIALWVFGLLSFILYLVGTYMAFLHVDSSRRFYESYVKFTENDLEFERLSKAKSKIHRDADKEYANKVQSVKDKWHNTRSAVIRGVEGKDEEISQLITIHNEIISKYKKLDEQCNSWFLECIQHYRTHNLSTRVSNPPTSWERDLQSLELNKLEYEKL